MSPGLHIPQRAADLQAHIHLDKTTSETDGRFMFQIKKGSYTLTYELLPDSRIICVQEGGVFEDLGPCKGLAQGRMIESIWRPKVLAQIENENWNVMID